MKVNEIFGNINIEELGKNFGKSIEIINSSLSVMDEYEKQKYTGIVSSINNVNKELKEKGFESEKLNEISIQLSKQINKLKK